MKWNRAEVRTIMGKMRRLEMRGWNNTTQYRLFGKELLQLMRVYKASKRAGCKCKIYSKKKMDKMFSTAEAFNQQAVEGVTQECVCENEKTERSRKVFNDSMKLVGVASFFSEFGERE
jgi:hypothetical protein